MELLLIILIVVIAGIIGYIGFELINENDDGKTFYINGKSLYGDDGFITMTD